MNVLGVLGSPRIKGNSDILLDQALLGAQESGAEVEKIVLAQKKISGCMDCKHCIGTGSCVIDDDMQEIHGKILQAGAIIHSVPVYFFSMTAQMKAYLDRWCAFFDAEWKWHEKHLHSMQGKKIGVITVCGAPDVSIADPVLHSFQTTSQFTGMSWLGAVRASAAEKGAVDKDQGKKQEAYSLGKRAVSE